MYNIYIYSICTTYTNIAFSATQKTFFKRLGRVERKQKSASERQVCWLLALGIHGNEKYVDVPLPLSDATGAKSYLHTQLFSHKKKQLQAEKRASMSSFRHFQPSLLHLQSNLLPPSSHTRKLMVLYVATNTPSRRQHCPTSMMGSTAKTCWKTVTSLDHVPLRENN